MLTNSQPISITSLLQTANGIEFPMRKKDAATPQHPKVGCVSGQYAGDKWNKGTSTICNK